MPIWILLAACQNDRYLNHTIVEEVDATATAAMPEEAPECDGPMIDVAPHTLSFISILTPFEKDIALRTDTQSVRIVNNCDTDFDVYVTASGGDVGQFFLVREDGDRDGAGSGEFEFTLAAFTTHMRNIVYSADGRAAVAEYDNGNFNAYVVEDATLGFHASATLEATVINVLMME